MSQALQDWYLESLGIVRYESKNKPMASDNLAAHPVAPSVPEQVVALSVVTPSPVVESKTASPVKSTPDVVRKDVAPTVEPTEAPVVHVAFNYAAWHPVDDVLLINDLGAQQLSTQHTQLLSNILRAIKRLPENGVLPAMESIGWPISGDASESGAKTLLATFLAARIKTRGVCWVVFMGQGSIQYIEGEVSENGASIEMPFGAKGLVVPSLDEMLNDPSLKKQTWQAIAHLAESP